MKPGRREGPETGRKAGGPSGRPGRSEWIREHLGRSQAASTLTYWRSKSDGLRVGWILASAAIREEKR